MVDRSDRVRRVFVRSNMIHSTKHNPATKAEGSVEARVKINYSRARQTLGEQRRRSPKLYTRPPRAYDLPEACGIGEPVTYLAASRRPAV